MHLLGCSFLTLVVGLALLLVLQRRRGSSFLPAFLEMAFGLLVAESFLLITTLMLPSTARLMSAGVAAFLLLLTRARLRKQTPSGFLLAGSAMAVLVFPLVLAVLDSAISTRQFVSDKELVEAALRMSLTRESLAVAAPLFGTVFLASILGHFMGRIPLLSSSESSRRDDG